MSLKCAPVLAKIKTKVAAVDPNGPRKVLFVYLINITQEGKQVKQFTLDLKKLEAYEGAYNGTPDSTITVDDMALALMGAKKLTQEEATKQGKLKMEGNEEAVKKMAILGEKFKEE